MKLRYLLGVALVLAAAGGGYAYYHHTQNTDKTSAAAQLTQSASNPVVLSVNGKDFRQSDILTIARTINVGGKAVPTEQLLDMIIPRMINTTLIYDDAARMGIPERSEIQQKIEETRKEIVIQAYAEDVMKDKMTPSALKKRYEKFAKENPIQDQLHIRHILLKTEGDAKKVIEQLKQGTDFAKLAKEKSTDTSATKNAGDLGYFTKDMLVEPFASVAFSGKMGLLDTPVQTEFGWHVIQVVDKKKTTLPKFELIEPQLRNMLAQEMLADILGNLSKKGNVQRFNWDGSPLSTGQNTTSPATGG